MRLAVLLGTAAIALALLAGPAQAHHTPVPTVVALVGSLQSELGCPVCNKLVVALLGASSATSTFAPAQPFLGVAAVALAATALGLRVRAIRRGACPLPAPGGKTHVWIAPSGARANVRPGE